jgi:hypothetical protein
MFAEATSLIETEQLPCHRQEPLDLPEKACDCGMARAVVIPTSSARCGAFVRKPTWRANHLPAPQRRGRMDAYGFFRGVFRI